MIIKTKRVTAADKNGGKSEIKVETRESNKPGEEIKEKVIKTYKTKVKPGLKKAVSEASSDFKEMVTREG